MDIHELKWLFQLDDANPKSLHKKMFLTFKMVGFGVPGMVIFCESASRSVKISRVFHTSKALPKKSPLPFS